MNKTEKNAKNIFGQYKLPIRLSPKISIGETELTMGLLDNYEDVREGKPKSAHHIKGIVCDVKNCVHHDGDNYCTADKIAVGPSFATSCSDTVCASFKARSL